MNDGKLRQYMPVIAFNVGELLLVALSGIGLGISLTHIVLVVLAFIAVRFSAGGAMHYKSWKLCLVWSLVVFLSMFVIANVDLLLSIVLAAFCAVILSNRANISDMFMWKAKSQPGRYHNEISFVQNNQDSPELAEFEARLKADEDTMAYVCYTYIFKQGRSWDKTAQELDTDTPRLAPVVERIAFALRMVCKL